MTVTTMTTTVMTTTVMTTTTVTVASRTAVATDQRYRSPSRSSVRGWATEISARRRVGPNVGAAQALGHRGHHLQRERRVLVHEEGEVLEAHPHHPGRGAGHSR